jgi:hypothetical protein
MKTLSLFLIGIWIGMVLSAQEKGPLPKISQQLADYFGTYPKVKVFVVTDKTQYKPGETVWFRAFVTTGNNLPVTGDGPDLYIKLFDKKGFAVMQDIYKLRNGVTPGDFVVPQTLRKGNYALVAYTSAATSPEEISTTILHINPLYANQLVAEVHAKDSISTSGKKNELQLELRDISGEIQKRSSLRYQIRKGAEVIDKGKFKTDDIGKAVIPFTLPEKSNAEPFICELSDNNDQWNQEIFLPTDLDPVSIKFFSEGGNLIAGTPSKVGFYAFNKWGVPVNVEGSVIDQNGKSLCIIQSFSNGVGLFTMPTVEKQKYKLVLSGNTGKNQSFDLPDVLDAGLALSVVKTDAEFITSNLVFSDKQKHSIALVVNQGSNIYWAADLEINGMGRIKIPTENLPHGINQLSVFSADGNLLAHRIVFIDKKQELKISVVPGQSNLKAGEKMKVKIALSNENGQPVSGNVCISVSDQFRNQNANASIDDCFLFSDELETPIAAFLESSKGKISNSAMMDVFLIANNLKGYDWERILKYKAESTAESNSGESGISGIVMDKNGKRIGKAKVSLITDKNMQLHTTTTNADGRFTFPSLSADNKDGFSVKATDAEGKHELEVIVNKNLTDRISDFAVQTIQKYNLTETVKFAHENYFKNNPDLISKVPKSIKPITSTFDSQRKMLETATSILDVIKATKAYRITNNQIVFVGFENSINFQGGALIVVDGQQLGTDISVISNIAPTDVDHIFVTTNPMEIQRYTGLNSVGLVEIFTKKTRLTDSFSGQEVKSDKHDGIYRVPNQFQESGSIQNKQSTTLLWNAEQAINSSGQFEFTVTAGQVFSDFLIEVQGITPDGRLGTGAAKLTIGK